MGMRKELITIKSMVAKRVPKGQKREWSAWQQPHMYPKRYLLVCCDCGLAHHFQFSVVKGRVQFRVRRAPGYTKAFRKARRHVCVKP